MLFGNGCQPPAAETPSPHTFGDAYEILTTSAPAEPEMLPFIADDTLNISVAYQGGCDDHDFELDYRVARDTTVLWLRHDANGDSCESYLRDELLFAAPRPSLKTPTIILLNPQGGPPFLLRRGADSLP